METHLIFSKCLVPTTKQKRGSFTPEQADRQLELWLHSACLQGQLLVLSRSLWAASSPFLSLSEQQGGFRLRLNPKLLQKHLPPSCCSQELPLALSLLPPGLGTSVLTSQLQQAEDAEELPPLHGWNSQSLSLLRGSSRGSGPGCSVPQQL